MSLVHHSKQLTTSGGFQTQSGAVLSNVYIRAIIVVTAPTYNEPSLFTLQLLSQGKYMYSNSYKAMNTDVLDGHVNGYSVATWVQGLVHAFATIDYLPIPVGGLYCPSTVIADLAVSSGGSPSVSLFYTHAI